MRDRRGARALRIVAVILMSLTAVFTIMGGAGTTCVALDPTGYDGKFIGLAPFQLLYILFVVVTLAIGVMGVRAVVLIVRGARNAYRYALIALIAGAVVGIGHVIASRMLRGGSMPVDMVVYTTLATLAFFLVIRLPALWQGANFAKGDGSRATGQGAATAAMAACGLLALTIQLLMAPTHTIGGVNYADVWHVSLAAIGGALIVWSAARFLRRGLRAEHSGRLRDEHGKNPAGSEPRHLPARGLS
jgi:hypothetical protein